MRRVTDVPGTYTVQGKGYGPFSATDAEPFTEVPDALVQALGLPVHDSDPQLREERAAQAKAAALDAENDGANLDELLQANADLKADLDKAQAQVQELEAQLAAQPSAGPVALPADLRDKIAALKNVSEAKADEIMDLIHEALAPAPEADAQ